MTVTVRALALRDLSATNLGRVVMRETMVGLINGVLLAIVMGGIAVLWFGSNGLGSSSARR